MSRQNKTFDLATSSDVLILLLRFETKPNTSAFKITDFVSCLQGKRRFISWIVPETLKVKNFKKLIFKIHFMATKS